MTKRYSFFDNQSKARCYFCKRLISKHKPKETKTCLMMVSAYTDKLRTIYSRPDMKKAIHMVQLARLKASRDRARKSLVRAKRGRK